ncbi:MAG: hypothetical protein JEY94_07320 [Melioribacteraceae bacterium]|nr:hypothetical protein [Melioribacteraceae bacterium]
MSSILNMTYEGDHICVGMTGKSSNQNSMELWQKINDFCKNYNCYNILGISEMETPLNIEDAYNYWQVFEKAGIDTGKYRIAWVEKNLSTKEVTKIVESVVKNREMVSGYIFNNVADAKKWLLNKNG